MLNSARRSSTDARRRLERTSGGTCRRGRSSYPVAMVDQRPPKEAAEMSATEIVSRPGVEARRTPGSMVGEIWMAPDFDELPDDMEEAFGLLSEK